MSAIGTRIGRIGPAVVLVAGLAGPAVANDGMPFYGVKEGQVSYALSGSRSGTKVLAFSDNGARTRSETHAVLNMMGMSQREDSVVYTDGPWVYTLDAAGKTARKQRSPLVKDPADGASRTKPAKKPEDFLTAMGGRKAGTDRLLGHACDIWELAGLSTKTCVTKEGLALWTEVAVGPMVTKETATEIKIGSLPRGATVLPPGIAIVEAEDPLARMRQMQRPGGDGATASPGRGRALTPEEMQDAAKMRDMYQGKDMQKLIEQMQKMQGQPR
jgi:hypothetical protein